MNEPACNTTSAALAAARNSVTNGPSSGCAVGSHLSEVKPPFGHSSGKTTRSASAHSATSPSMRWTPESNGSLSSKRYWTAATFTVLSLPRNRRRLSRVTTNEWSPDAARSGYLDALTGVLTLARSLDADEWTLPTDLHAWNVFDNVAHVVAVEDELAGRPVPSSITDWSEFPHVETPYQQYTEVGVNSRRGKAPQELLDELEGLIPERERQLVSTPAEPTAEMRGPAGMVGPVMRVMGTRTLDIWSHEQDV